MTKSFFAAQKEKAENLLLENGVKKNDASIIADVMATADACGVSSHGVAVLASHIEKIKAGGYNLDPSFKTVKETDSFAVIDGDNAFGFLSADYSMRYAAKRAKGNGIFFVFCKSNNTFGPAFYYPLQAAKNGLIGIIMSNSPAQMAAPGGKEKLIGTNPFAAVIPVPNGDPIIIDMATSVVAKSKFKQYKEQGKPLPEGWALDENGNPTTDPDEAIKGFVQPMAGHKGYGIALLIDILSGVLSGSAYLNKVGRFYSEDKKCMDVGFCCIAIDPYTISGDAYDDRITDFVKIVRSSESIEGETVSLPGDRKHKAKAENIKE